MKYSAPILGPFRRALKHDFAHRAQQRAVTLRCTEEINRFFLSAVFLRISIHRWYSYSFVEDPNKLLPTELTVQHRRASFLTTPLSCWPRKSCSLYKFHHPTFSDLIARRQQTVHTVQASCPTTILLPCKNLINKLNNLQRRCRNAQKIFAM